MIRHRLRIRFCKQDDLRLLSHRDLVRAMERMFRRAGLPLGMSEGFHPKPRMSFPLALAVGIAGLDEVMELELSEELTADQVQNMLEPCLPAGMLLNQVEVLPAGQKKGVVREMTLTIGLPEAHQAQARERIAALLASEEYIVGREEGKGNVDLRPYIVRLEVVGEQLQIGLRVTPQGTARPREVLAALGLADLEQAGFCITRTEVLLETPNEKAIA